MSYAVRRPAGSLRSSGDADTPTTATVLDYSCLFTHDLRRKQKRWQDGRLKFHTFNKRIMVYDDRGNFIGDSHWHSSDALDEGEELELDRGSAIVQVADCTGSREQDLTELLDKRVKEVEQRRASAAARTAPAQQTPVRRREGQPRQPQPHFQLKHRPLSAIVPSPGPIGRAAIPHRSPFEARRAEAEEEQQQPPVAKRRRVSVSPPSKRGFAQSLFGARLTLSACPAPTPPATVRVSKEQPGIGRLPASHELAENDDDDVVMLDGPPPGQRNSAAKPAQLRTGPAKVKGVAALRDTSWEPPRARANVDTATRNISRHAEPDVSPSSRLAGSARPVPPARTREPDKRAKPAKSTDQTQTGISQISIARGVGEAHGIGEAASPFSVHEGPDVVPLIQSKAPAQETSLRSLAGEQSSAPQRAELRTELRIKPRQRRRLLIMSAKHAQPGNAHARPLSRPASTRQSPKASPRLEALKRSIPVEEAPEAQDAVRSGSELDTSCHAASALADSGSEDNVAPVEATRRGRIASIDAYSSTDDEVLDRRQRANTRRVPESDGDGSEGWEEHFSRAHGCDRRRTHDTSDESCSSPDPPTRKSTRRSCRRKKNTEQNAETLAPSRPRITKMARKSVRSREIIGYVPPAEDDMVPALFAAAATRNALGASPILNVGSTGASAPLAAVAGRGDEAKTRLRNDAALPLAPEPDGDEAGMDTKSVANVEGAVMPAMAPRKKPVGTATPEEDPPQASTKASLPAAEAPNGPAGVTMAGPASPGREAAQGQSSSGDQGADRGPRRQISNPATRGKKAARREDAAGHPLQNLVPMEPAAPAPAAPAPTVKTKRQESVLPGFSRANGGAWSKHAEDLLGMTRPAGSTRGG